MDGLLDAYELDRGADRSAVAQLAMRIVAQMAGTHQGESGPARRDLTLTLARAARSGDPGLFAYLQTEFRQRKITAERVIDVYIPAAVELLGNAWHNDELGILEVTVAFARLQDLLRELGIACAADRAGRHDGPRVLMAIPAREQHIIGALLATNRMRRMGVSVCIAFMATPDTLAAHLDEFRFDAVFISIANRASVEPCIQLVRAVRRLCPEGMPVAVGGYVTDLGGDSLSRIGADVITKDVDRALAECGLIAHRQLAV